MRYTLVVVSVGISCAVSMGVQAEIVTLCRQNVEYSHATPSTDVTAKMRSLVGAWSGEHIELARGDGRELARCIGLVVEVIDAQGHASGKYVTGDKVRVLNNAYTVPMNPSVSSWKGQVTGDVLRFGSGAWAYELQVSDSSKMQGRYSNAVGIGPVWLKRQ
jgi:hypothetical protein